ncbi:MAG: phage terminase small subunit P27 family [Candidatus Marinimicrobia bacterium]|nr:phage terminase small subunit P27 family [Candidatus Neomarinimicrobiota bacterium]
MGRGRPNTPASVKAREGNRGKRQLNFGALFIKAEIPEKPKHLTGEAAKEWQRLADVLKDNGLITLLDRAALMIYCDAFKMYTEAIKELRKDGYVDGMLQKTPNGYKTLSGLALVLREAKSTMLSIMVQFGMTPSAREKVSINPNQLDLPFPAGRVSMN